MAGRELRAVGLSFAIPAAMSIGCADAPTSAPAVSDAADIDDAGDAGPLMAGACGPVGPWGEWPPEDAPVRTPTVLPPAFKRPDCGPGCRLVTTRWDSTGNGPWEIRLAGRLLTGTPRGVSRATVVNLDTLEEYDSNMPEPEPGVLSLSAALSDECLVQEFQFYGPGNAKRYYLCETCLHRQATRGLRFAEGMGDANIVSGVVVADERFVILGGGLTDDGTKGLGLWALDLRDGSKRTFAPSLWLFSNLSYHAPYIVLSEGDGEVHLIDTRDWSDTNVTNDPSLQYMAASDGKTIVWIDQRYHPGGTLEKPENQEVVAHDIGTKELRRLTFTDPAKPSAKWDPSVEGDWVVWTDDRDSNAPNTTQDVPKNRRDIYGFNLKTGKEYHVLGNQAGTLTHDQHDPKFGLLPSLPRLHMGKLYVLGALMEPDQPQLPRLEVWEIALPEP